MRPCHSALGRLALALVTVMGTASCSHPRDLDSGAATARPTASAAAAGCAAPLHSVAPSPDAASLARVATVFDRFAARAWNPQAPPAKPSTLTGGVYVNYTANWDGHEDPAANTNIRTTGASDSTSGASPRHDPLNDLLILRDLDAYLATGGGAQSAAVLTLRCQLGPVTQAEFASYGVARGWVYQQLTDLSQLDTAGPWREDARNLATRFAKLLSNVDALGTTSDKPLVRPDWIAECAAALVDAGTRFAQPDWTQLGHRLATRLIKVAANPATGLFAGQLKLTGSAAFAVADPLVKIGAQAQLVDSLLSVYVETSDLDLLAAVDKAFTSLTSTAIGVLDADHGGWFYAVNADGTAVRKAYKESRQAWMLPLLRDLQALPAVPGSAAPTGLEGLANSTGRVVRDQLYQKPAQGYVYRTDPAFGAYLSTVEGKQVQEDWVSTEATGIAVDALLGPLR